MIAHPLPMPPYVAELVRMPLLRLGLEPEGREDGMILCPLIYENGTEVVFATLLAAKAVWLGRQKRIAMLSLCELGEDGRPKAVHFRDEIAAPSGPHDVHFTMKISAKIRSMAWALAATGTLGECCSLPERPQVPDSPSSR